VMGWPIEFLSSEHWILLMKAGGINLKP